MMNKIYRRLRCASVIFLLMGTVSAFAQKQILSGKITDNTKLAMPGVNVILKGTTIGTTTDADGSFSLEANSSDVLVISFIGYKTQKIAVGNKTRLDLSLEEDVATLSEVVVVGYVEMKRTDLSSAQTSISDKELKTTLNTTLEQAIQGRSAGVYVTQNSGQPGGGMSVNIRGVNTLNGANEPLYVVDGIQIQQNNSVSYGAQSSSNPLAGLNPTDIEDIQVLQGPSATAQYGSRATNGVVIITTKRGKSGQVKISYDYQVSAQTKPKSLDVLNLQQYAQMSNDFHDRLGGQKNPSFLDPTLLGKGTNWQNELFQVAPMTKHQLSLSGGDKTTYYLSSEYLKQGGVAIGSGFDRYSIRLNIDNKPKDWATIGVNINFNQTKEKLTATQENTIVNALQISPQVPVKNLDGSWGGADEINGANRYSPVNPVAIANLTTNNNTRNQFLAGLNIGIKIIDGLSISTSLNTNLGFSSSDYFTPKYKFGTFNENPNAKSTTGAGTNTYWNWNQRIDYTKKLGKHSISALFLHEAQESTWKNLTGTRTGYLNNDVIDLNAGDLSTAESSGGRGEWAMESYLLSSDYNFDNRYILRASVRRDGSANFGANNKWGTFPALSAAWRISQESFFNVPFINDLKLRLETGITGNQGGGGGVYSRLANGATSWGSGFLVEKYPNPNLGWEETKTNNIGLNVGMFNSRVQIEVDYYIKNTDNLIMDSPQPGYLGTTGTGAVGNPTLNIGSLENKGWGVTINTVNVDRNGFKWASNVNLSSFKTKITKLNTDAANISRKSWWLDNWIQQAVVGQAPWQFLGYQEDGLFKSIEEINSSALPKNSAGTGELPVEEENGVWVGDAKFKDISGPNGQPDGLIDQNDQTFIGNPWPKLFAGFTNTFSYKGFDLSVLITGTYGNDVYNNLARVNTNPNNINVSRNLMVDVLNFARVTTDAQGIPSLANPDTKVARLSYGPNGNYLRHTSRWVEDGSYMRVKNVTLSYNIPHAFLTRQNIVKSLRVSVSGQNLYTLTHYKGYDPEVGAYVGRDVDANNQPIGLDYGRYPLTAVYSFGINATF